MNWEAIGAVGETVSALAVLATLVYLALQVRGLSADMYSAHLSRHDEGERDLRKIKLDHADLMLKASDPNENLTELERLKLQEIYRCHEAFFFFGYLRAKTIGGVEEIHARIFAEALEEYPALITIFEGRDFSVLDNPDRIRFAELVKQELRGSVGT